MPSQMHLSAGSLLGIFVALFSLMDSHLPEYVHTEFLDSVRA